MSMAISNQVRGNRAQRSTLSRRWAGVVLQRIMNTLTEPNTRDAIIAPPSRPSRVAASRQGKEAADIKIKLATLSPRELEVMDQIAQGFANKEIASRLARSERTVANHRAHALSKLEAANTADLVRKLGLVGRIGPRNNDNLPHL